MPNYEGNLRKVPGARYAILVSRWNAKITEALLQGAHKALLDNGIDEDAIDIVRVPGAWELPLAAQTLAASESYVALLVLGCVVRGDTRHYEHVADRCAEALMRVSTDYNIPVCNGVLAVERLEDAQARAGGQHGNKGEEVAVAAIEMADLLLQLDEVLGDEITDEELALLQEMYASDGGKGWTQ
ncbi:6,7-dimethyl-8-ribityllumazine synthase [Lysobacteraceae bacterium NML95-0200]|nr:6,7-dimethyl-8-ribityllumazine synthase [Xanthomonadaceae bacterium NML95-0200]